MQRPQCAAVDFSFASFAVAVAPFASISPIGTTEWRARPSVFYTLPSPEGAKRMKTRPAAERDLRNSAISQA